MSEFAVVLGLSEVYLVVIRKGIEMEKGNAIQKAIVIAQFPANLRSSTYEIDYGRKLGKEWMARSTGWNYPEMETPSTTRQLVIENTITKENWAMQFDSAIVKDSEALHNLLCYVDPGDVYTVSFTSETEDLLPAKCLFQGIERPNVDWLSSDN